MLARFVFSKLQNYESYWHVRKQFTVQTGIIGYLSYLLSMGKQDPFKISISTSSGLIQYADLRPNYKTSASNGTTELGNNELVPFRLTPNMSHFIGTAGIKGVLPASMMALSNALKENESFLEDYLHLYFNDDMQAFERKQNKHRHTSINDTASVGSTNLDTDGNEQALSESFRLKKSASQNVNVVLNRINKTVPVSMPPKYDRSTCMTSGRPLNEGAKINDNIRLMIDSAMDPKLLSQMPPNWQSWL